MARSVRRSTSPSGRSSRSSGHGTHHSSHGSSRSSRRTRGWRRIGYIKWSLITLAAITVGLLVLGIPLARAAADAESAKGDLERAQANITANNIPLARADLNSAKEHSAAAQETLHGLSGRVWSWVPFVGSGIVDARHMVDATRNTAQVAASALDLQDMVKAQEGQLVNDSRINLRRLRPLIDEAVAIGTPLTSALDSLRQVKGTAPFVGGWLADQRDKALLKLAPVEATYVNALPALKAVPQIVGADQKQKYLIAVLNPGELRYSGGATLSLAQMTADRGQLHFSKPEDLNTVVGQRQLISWEPVTDNPLHRAGPQRLSNATFNPNWSISGEELLRAWEKQSGSRCDGVIAIDLQGLSRLFRITGPVSVAPYGQLNADNLVAQLAGSYDDYRPEAQRRRHELNNAIIPAFRSRFLTGGSYSEKLTALREAGAARQFAMYFRDAALESAMSKMGLDGDLSRTKGDFIFVATQNLNGSKVDFFQQRTIDATVTINSDRSITSRVVATFANKPPAFAGNGIDPKRGYYTRWAGIAGAVFVPDKAEISSARLNGALVRRNEFTTRDRRFFFRQMLIQPGGKRNLAFTYSLKNAVSAEPDGSWKYSLVIEPQSIAQPQTYEISVSWPAGKTLDPVRSPGWTATSATSAQFSMSGIPTTTNLALVLK